MRAPELILELVHHQRLYTERLRQLPAARRVLRSTGPFDHENPPIIPTVFVGGCPRSGTTWVAEILARHPETITHQESHLYPDLWEPIVGHGRRSVRAWNDVLATDAIARRRKSWVRLHRYIDRDTFETLCAAAAHRPDTTDEETVHWLVARVLWHWYERQTDDQRRVLVEKTPAHLRYAHAILDAFPHARFVEVLRDGRDVAVSMEKLDRPWTPSGLEQQLGVWAGYARAGDELRRTTPHADRLHLVRYEDLKHDPAGQIADLYEFAGLDTVVDGIDLAVHAAEVTDFAKQPKTGEGLHRRKGVVGDWRNHFSDEDIALADRLIGAELELAGYERR